MKDETLVLPEVYTEHATVVNKLVKSPVEILEQTSPLDIDILHMTLGLYDEVAELVEGIVLNDIENVLEELGDIEFYWFGFQTRLGIGVAMGHRDPNLEDIRFEDLVGQLPIVTNNMLGLIKKLFIYRDESILAELCMRAEQWRAFIQRVYEWHGLTVEEAKRHNIDKLKARYPLDEYTNEHAQKRLDKN